VDFRSDLCFAGTPLAVGSQLGSIRVRQPPFYLVSIGFCKFLHGPGVIFLATLGHNLLPVAIGTVGNSRIGKEGRMNMRTIWVIIIVLAVFIGGALLFAWSGLYDVAADKPHRKIVAWFLEEVRERSIAVRSRNISPPAPGSVKQNMVENASYYYYGTCIICHGAQGNPPNKFSSGLDPAPPDFASPTWDRPEEREMFWIIKNGIKMTAMASFGERVFKDDQIWAMVDLLKTLPRNEPKKGPS
jgi:hypothetical protein